MESDSRKPWYASMFVGGWGGDDGHSHGYWINPGAQFRLSSRFSASFGLNYSRFIDGLAKAGLLVDRKVLSDLAIHEPAAFAAIVEKAKVAIAA